MKKGGEFREKPSSYKTSLLSNENWPQVKGQLLKIVTDCFPKIPMPMAESLFTKTYAKDVVVLLEDEVGGKLTGFSQAHIYTGDTTIANIGMTGIALDKQGQGLVGLLMERLEAELKSRGVTHITRQARTTHGYADSIERHYQDRIVEKREFENSPDPKRHFKIKL